MQYHITQNMAITPVLELKKAKSGPEMIGALFSDDFRTYCILCLKKKAGTAVFLTRQFVVENFAKGCRF